MLTIKRDRCLGRKHHQEQKQKSSVRQHDNRKHATKSMGQQQQHHQNKKQKQVLVFDQNERVNYVKGFAKRKQERREKAKLEAIEKDREMRRLFRQKRREALNKSRSAAASTEAQVDDEANDNDLGDDGCGPTEEKAEKD